MQLGDAVKNALPTTNVRAPPDAQTQLNLLHAPLRTLAKHLAPSLIVIDCGGEGQCGPNSLAYLLGLAGLPEADGLDGPSLRESVRDYVAVPSNLDRKTNCLRSDGSPFSLGDLIIVCLLAWPDRDLDKEVSVAAWAGAIAQPATWTDLAFVHVVADAYGVSIDAMCVDDLSEVWHMGRIMPCENNQGMPLAAELVVGLWWNRHMVAIAMPSRRGTAAPAGLNDAPPPPPAPDRPQGDPPSGPDASPAGDLSGAAGAAAGAADAAAGDLPLEEAAPVRRATLAAEQVSRLSPQPPAVRDLSAALAPHEMVVDCGGGGNCAPNSLAYLLRLLGQPQTALGCGNLAEGATVRARVVAHAAHLVSTNMLVAPGGNDAALHICEYLQVSMAAWPPSARHGREASPNNWLSLMGRLGAWADEAFMVVAADCYQITVECCLVRGAVVVRRDAFAPLRDAALPPVVVLLPRVMPAQA